MTRHCIEFSMSWELDKHVAGINVEHSISNSPEIVIGALLGVIIHLLMLMQI